MDDAGVGIASDAEAAWALAQQIGLPVVAKPKDGNQGKGVTVNIDSRESLLAAFTAAFAALVWISILGLLLYGLVAMLSRLLAPWAEDKAA